jgi:hypothetical protein
MDLTLLEIHLDDASFTANAPFSDDSSEAEPAAATATESAGDEDGGDLRTLVPFLVGLGALAGIAYLVRRLRRGGETGTEIEAEIGEPEAPTP